MSDNLKFVRKLCKDAVAAGYVLSCEYGGEVDYRGTDPKQALEALTACDEMNLVLRLQDASGKLRRDADGRPIGKMEMALIIPDVSNEPEEVIADFRTGGWIEKWWEENLRGA